MTKNNANNGQNDENLLQNEARLQEITQKQQNQAKNQNVEDAMNNNPEMQAELEEIIKKMREAKVEEKGVDIEDIEKENDEGKENKER